MKYRGQEEKEFSPKHLIVTGPVTDANYDLIKNQLTKSRTKTKTGLDWRHNPGVN